jgi:glucokinase
MNQRGPPVLALDMGGSKLALALVRPDGSLQRHVRRPTAEVHSGDQIVGWVAEQVASWGARPQALGVSAGGPLDDQQGVILGWPRMQMIWGYPLCDRLRQGLGSLERVRLVNDGCAACAGEVLFGAGQGLSRVLYMTISTGIGGGAVLGGRLQRGQRGNSAEFGHMIVDPGGPPCDCGGRGHLEALASGSGIYRRAVAAGLLPQEEFGWARAGQWLAQRLAAGDEAAGRLWAEALSALATGLANLHCCYVPQAVVLGGGLSRLVLQHRQRLLELVQGRSRLLPFAAQVLRFSDSRDTIPLLGAAAVAGGWIATEE